MTIRISFSDNAVRVAVEIDGKIESAITELPQREWVGLTDEEIQGIFGRHTAFTGKTWAELYRECETKLKEKNA